MGTRADFYVGRGEQAEWLGSIAWDGYPAGIDKAIFQAATEAGYRAAVTTFLAADSAATTPDMGWPWPWDDSCTTDYAYAFEDGQVYGSSFGHPWFAVDLEGESFGEPEDDGGPADKTAVFPDMSERKNVTFGPRSGTITIGGA